MRTQFFGHVDEPFVEKSLARVLRLLPLLPDVTLYILEDQAQTPRLVQKLPSPARKEASRLCRQQIPFSLRVRRGSVVVLPLTRHQYSSSALTGLLCHELAHVLQEGQGVYQNIDRAFTAAWEEKTPLFESLPYPRAPLFRMLEGVRRVSQRLLKELYANSFLIQQGSGGCLVDYYVERFGQRKTCPRPVLYKKFKKAAQQDMGIIQIAFEFEFSLLGVLLPFEKLASQRAKKLMRHIDSCYRLNTLEVSRKCRELVTVYMRHYGKKSFDEEFFSQVLEKVYYLLK